MQQKISITQISDFQGGMQPPKSEFIEKPQNGYIRLLQIRDFDDDSKAIYVKDKSNIKKCLSDDVLIGRYGASVGKVLTGKEGAYNVAMMKIIPIEGVVLKRFMFYILKSYQFQKFIKIISESRAAQAGFNKKDLSRFFLYLPNIEKQEKIIAQLDTIQTLIDKRHESSKLLDKFLRSIFFDMFGDPVTNPKKIKTINLGNPLLSISSGYTPDRTNSEYYNGDIFWAKSADIKGKYIYKTQETITQKAISESGAKIFPENSVLIAMYGQGKTRGRVAILGINASCNQACAVLNSKTISSIFIFSFFNYSYDYLRSLSKGGNRDNLSLSVLKKIKLFVPSLLKQKEYELIFETIDKEKRRQNNSLDILQNLFQSVLQDAFKKDSEINEEPIFRELIKTMSLDDLVKKPERLRLLINLFKENNFENQFYYSEAKEKLFDLLSKDNILQNFNNESVELLPK